MEDKQNYLRYIARVKLKNDVRRNREKTLEVLDLVKLTYGFVGGPNLSYDLTEEQEPNNWLFFYSNLEKDLHRFGDEIISKGFATEVTYGLVRPSYIKEFNPRSSRLVESLRKLS